MAALYNWVTGSSSGQSGQNDLCEVCGIKPKFKDAVRTHPYCGKSCAAKAPNCPIPSCRQKGLREFGGACSARHQNTVVICSMCRATPSVKNGLCSECFRIAQASRTHLMELPAHDAGFQEAQKMFIDGWQKPQKPRVGRVFRIQMGEAAQEGRGKYQASAGECFRIPVWYSAQCICDLGAPNKQLEFCSYKSCGICIPLTTAFTAFEFGQAVLRGNFGEGIYMTRDPSLADQFAISTTGSPFRVILLNSLVLPTRPARKGESVLSDNGDVFFKNPLAITPDYLICYQK